MSDVTRVLVADDHELFRRGVIGVLRATPDFSVELEAASGSEALRLARLHLPELVLLDLGLPDRDGLEVVGDLHHDCPVARIVVLTVNEDEEVLLKALRAGASAYLLKGIAADELVRALHAVVAGESYVSPTMAGRLLREMDRETRARISDLSDREREVLEGLATGATNREIAERLHLSEKTVKFYVTNVLTKLHARNRVEAAVLAQGSILAQRQVRP